MAIEYLWGDSPYWTNIAHTVGYCLSLALMIVFMRRMVATRRLTPQLDRALKALVVVQVLLIAGLMVSFPLFVKPTLLNLGVGVAIVLAAGVRCALLKDRGALFFVVAFGILCMAGVLSSLRALGFLPTNVLTTDGVQFGSAIEMIVLAFALADRYNQLRREKDKAQREALKAQGEALAAEQRVVETLKESERVLEGRVAERTSELSQTISRLKQTQAELVQADKLASLGSLVAGVAHELNTPIGNALTTASTLEMAARDFRDTMQRGEMRKSTVNYFVDSTVPMAELIMRSCQRAAALITSFKQVAVDQTSEQRRRFNLKALVEDNVAALRPSFRHAPWVIDVDLPGDIECDSYPGPLGQVISNLVQNAVVHAFDGRTQGTLRITAQRDGEQVELDFADDGKGMSDAVQAHIFEPFYTTRLGQGGSGLGLSISLNIVSGVLGGTLAVESAMGRGTRFTARFPAVAPVRDVVAADHHEVLR